VTIFEVMPVLKRDVARGSTIQPGDVVMKRTALESPASNALLGSGELAGATATRNLSMNEPILARDVSRAKALRKGEAVTLTIRNGSINVNANATSLQDAYIGDIAVIQIAGSMKEITAMVTGKGRMTLQLATR
ncbi:MAG: flagella basal body P-ring formation protein FlgA, partial [Candidatus Paceibacteria bacterium]